MLQPSSPWQFWKENHRHGRWIGWLVRKFPKPEYETISFTQTVEHSEEVIIDLKHSVIYPEAKAIHSPQSGSVMVRWVETEWK
jgi:hypothetical protein